MKAALTEIAKRFNQAGIVWAIGGSSMLVRHGLLGAARDIDVQVALSDAERADSALRDIAEMKELPPNPPFETRLFRHYNLRSFELTVDLMAGLRIRHEEGVYEHPFDSLSVTDKLFADGTELAYAAVEDWAVLYGLMPGREQKARMLFEYLERNGVRHPELIRRAMAAGMPKAFQQKCVHLAGMKQSGNKA